MCIYGLYSSLIILLIYCCFFTTTHVNKIFFA